MMKAFLIALTMVTSPALTPDIKPVTVAPCSTDAECLALNPTIIFDNRY